MNGISFVLPAYNESGLIEGTLDAIQRFRPENVRSEILLVDHGSSDNTVDLANSKAIVVDASDAKTIAQLRNIGAGLAKYDVLVFLDADVRLTDGWGEFIESVLDKLRCSPKTVSGSRVGISENPSWLERSWFGPMVSQSSSHVSTGHMIVTRWFFEALGGFDESLETGEDYDFSVRAVKMGGVLARDPRLKVSHEGNPRSLVAFFQRERWHGIGDTGSVRAIFTSKVACLSLLFLIGHFVGLVSLLTLSPVLVPATISIVLLCSLASFVKYRASTLRIRLLNSLLFYFYFAGRASAILTAAPVSSKRSRRTG